MRAILIPVSLIAALATGAAIEPVQAKGCIKGAIIGGIAGHYAGHGKVGAVAGCVIGRHEANKADAERAAQRSWQPQQPQTDDGRI